MSTISMMVILAVLAVALLSLSAISLKSTSMEAAEARARANARMALMEAVGRLQAEMGPDQRISANADILSANATVYNPRWMGAWDSWKAGRKSDGSPDTAGSDQLSFHNTVQGVTDSGLAPSYDPQRRDHFRSWLVSLPADESSNLARAVSARYEVNLMPDETDESVTLVERGSLGSSAGEEDFVHVPLCRISDRPGSTAASGRFGWWVSDQSQKARIMGDSYDSDSSLTLAEKIARSQAPGSTGTKSVTGLERITSEQDAMLASLPSLNTLDLVIPGNTVRPARENYHSITDYSAGVIADVREGGLKRDLSALLEREIDPAEFDSDPVAFSLYRFNTKDGWASSVGATAPQETVPIQDLAAYYQLYDAVSAEAGAVDPYRTSSSRGVRYSPSSLGGIDGPHLLSTDYGTTSNSPIYPREYSANYRQPKIIKVQFLASLFSRRINPPIPADRNNPTPNTHELLIGITPAITFWNPTNLPVIFQMNSNPALGAQMMRFRETPIQIRLNKNNGQTITGWSTFSYLNASGSQLNEMFSLYWAGIHPIRLEPGEVKTCSLPWSGDASSLKTIHGYNGNWRNWNQNFFFKTDTWYVGHEVKEGWEPESFIYSNNSAIAGTNNGTAPLTPTATDPRHVVNGKLRFKSSDRIQIEIGCGGGTSIGWTNNPSCYQDYNAATSNWDRSAGVWEMRQGAGAAFLQPLFRRGMTGGALSLVSASRSGSGIIARSATESGWPFMHFGVFAGTETSESSNSGFAGGRKFPSRPFLHSSPLHSYPFLDNSTGNDLYNFGWNWAVDLINDVYEAPVQVTATGSSYWGGGYTPESGTTHIIQQEIPLLPPISIAALSHARLGGWSISDQLEMPYAQMSLTNSIRKKNMNFAVGFGGLRPNVLQAIGNSYAHPLIDADEAYTIVSRIYNIPDGSFNESFVDHSYLANKAIWDEFFFSSITPQRSEVEVFESSDREAVDVAKAFFFDGEPLPNRRIKPYRADLDESQVDDLFAEKDDFIDGLADKIAAHLMVDGVFNVNSTSVEAWKVLFSSLKGKPVAYVDPSSALAGSDPSEASGHSGTPVGQFGLAGGEPYSGSPNDPRDSAQWTSWRELTDDEIEELATAMVRQVKLRGPFLSLSEFVNRRLDSSNPELAVKGALQAALDDPSVSINEAFTSSERKFSSSELGTMSPAFPLAAEGPVAYGSAAYVDQADILRGLAEQLTPRGDTFVIRAYGDSLDASGKVEARAWCEAVIQRTPQYVDPKDSNDPADTGDRAETKHAELSSEANKLFGRKMQMVSFRWLNASEI